MKEYQEFVELLKSEVNTIGHSPKCNWRERAYGCVDGLAASELRRLVPLEDRRTSGAFFTDSGLAQKVLALIKPTLTLDSVVYDPACGAGNLLIAAADIFYSISKNIDIQDRIHGTDIHSQFVEAAQIRLFINHVLQVSGKLLSKSGNLNFDIATANGLLDNHPYKRATHVIANPPFNLIESNDAFKWAGGKVSAAAVFMDKITDHVREGTIIMAILPDVLRSGTRYQKWRNTIQQKCSVENKMLLGQFDEYADVDVFALLLTKKTSSETDLSSVSKTFDEKCENEIKNTVDEMFDICVGPVVDNRDPKLGPKRGYIISRGLLAWKTIDEIPNQRQFSGKSYSGPFVVVKRTSRLGDKWRAAASIINSPEQVFIDNHLIILKPKSGELSDCQLLIENLRDFRTNDWLDNQIRCRHLTVKVVSKIPIWIRE